MPLPYRYDSTDQLRVIAPGSTFAEVTDVAFNQIRQNARSSAAVTLLCWRRLPWSCDSHIGQVTGLRS
jgi:uncharacterized membrane protein